MVGRLLSLGVDPDTIRHLFVYDLAQGAAARNRSYDNFSAFVPTFDAAIFASQSLELRHDRAEREDSTGTHWQNVSERRGNYLKIPPG